MSLRACLLTATNTGIVDQPLQAAISPGASAGSVLAGVGKGMLGAFTKPIGGAMALVSQTSLGLLNTAGLHPAPKRIAPPLPPSEPRSSYVLQ